MSAYRQLTQAQRYQIGTLRLNGFSLRAIADRVSCDFSSVSRELSRNARPRAGYDAEIAQRAAELRRHASRNRRITERDWAQVDGLIRRDSSPEQISGRLRHENGLRVGFCQIYRHIWENADAGGDLHRHLRMRKRRRKRYGRPELRGRIPGRIGIEERPQIVARRSRLGDWEGDTVVGRQRDRKVLLSLLERKSRYCKLGLTLRTARRTAGAATRRLRGERAHTLTVDNGKEFTDHARITRELTTKIFFADPYCAWQRGANENLNGLARQYFPKGQSLDDVSPMQIWAAQHRINQRPRKCLGWRTPVEVLRDISQTLTR